MKSTYLVRKATPDDCEATGALWMALLDEHASLDPRFTISDDALRRWKNDFPEWVHSDSAQIWLAEHKDEPVGFVSGERWLPPPIHSDPVELYIRELFISPPHRRQGLGSQLMEKMREWAERSGISRLRIGVLALNESGLEFWQKLGASPFSMTFTLDLADS